MAEKGVKAGRRRALARLAALGTASLGMASLGMAAMGIAAMLPGVGTAWAQDAALAEAAQFIRDAGNQLTAVTGAPAERKRRLGAFLAEIVDLDGVGRFCLGRYWASATPEQRRTYLELFRQMVVEGVASRVTDYGQERMDVSIGTPSRRGAEIDVPTVVTRSSGAKPVRLVWVVGADTGRLRIVDLVAEGVSLRLTKRSDTQAWLSKNGADIGALLEAMRRQSAGPA